MKNLKIIYTVALFSLTVAMNAQDKPNVSDEKKQEMVTKMKENRDRFNLTTEQEAPYKEITKRYALKLQGVKGSTMVRFEKLEKFKELQTQKNEEMKKLLSPEQFKTYIEIQEERKVKMMEKRKE